MEEPDVEMAPDMEDPNVEPIQSVETPVDPNNPQMNQDQAPEEQNPYVPKEEPQFSRKYMKKSKRMQNGGKRKRVRRKDVQYVYKKPFAMVSVGA